jgi:hypothetical protein
MQNYFDQKKNQKKNDKKNLQIKKVFILSQNIRTKKERIMFNQYNHTRTSKHTITMCMTMMMWVFEKPQFL